MTEPNEPMLVEFFRYNKWANLRLLEACENLSPEQLAASAPGTYGTIARTLEHLVDAEAFYYALLTGETLPPPFNWKENPPVPEIRHYYALVGQAIMEAAARVTPADVVHQKWEGGTTSYRALAPELDGWSYMWANRDRLVD